MILKMIPANCFGALSLSISIFIGMSMISTSSAHADQERGNSTCETILSDQSVFRLRRQGDRGLIAVGKSLTERAIGLKALRDGYAPYASRVNTPEDFWTAVLQSLNIQVQAQGSLEQIPPQGKAVVIAANHPYGFLDGVSLPHLVSQRRSDYMILGNSTLAEIPEIRSKIIPLKILSKDRKEQIRNAQFNKRAIDRAKEHLLSGGALLIFPSGVVSTGAELPWRPTAARLILETGSSYFPVYFDGKNSRLFHWISKLPKSLAQALRLALIPSELLKKSGASVNVILGKEMKPVELDALTQNSKIPKDRAVTEVMRNEVLKLSEDSTLHNSEKSPRTLEDLGNPLMASRRSELVHQALEAGHMEVYRETVSKINGDPLIVLKVSGKDLHPELLHHLGVLREETFRTVGEGSGKASDTDKFDLQYDHLLVWNKNSEDFVGAYRLGSYEEARASGDYSKMYSHEFFRYSPEFFKMFQGEMVEMGRSFVVPKHQNDPDILKLLWSAIAEYLYRDEKLRYLCGPVSLSGDYSPLSKTLIKSYYMKNHGDQNGLGKYITPSQEFTSEVALSPKVLDSYLSSIQKVSELDSYIESLEGPGKGIPPLMKHYPGLMGARFISVSEDPVFNTLDFLICVDISQLNERKAEIFVGDKMKAKALTERFKP